MLETDVFVVLFKFQPATTLSCACLKKGQWDFSVVLVHSIQNIHVDMQVKYAAFFFSQIKYLSRVYYTGKSAV